MRVGDDQVIPSDEGRSDMAWFGVVGGNGFL